MEFLIYKFLEQPQHNLVILESCKKKTNTSSQFHMPNILNNLISNQGWNCHTTNPNQKNCTQYETIAKCKFHFAKKNNQG